MARRGPPAATTGPETDSGRLTLAAVGDCLIGRHISALQDTDFLALVEILRGADCAWGNCEVVLADPRTVYKVLKTIDPHAHCEPWGADELRFMGINLMGTANNHTMDFGDQGLASTLANLDRVGIAHAGAGPDLLRAARPGFCETDAGWVALVDCAASCLDSYAAGASQQVLKGRPGLNPLQIQYTLEVDRDLFERLEEAQETIQDLLGWNEFTDIAEGMEKLRPAGAALFFETAVQAGEKVDLLSRPRPRDVSRILKMIQWARPRARVVVASIHAHGLRRRVEEPDPFLPVFARSCLDAGADVCLVTGPHVLRGIEIHQGKPIFYSLGNFFAHFGGPSEAPAGSPPGPRPRRPEGARLFQQRRFWESFVPRITFAEGGAAAIELYPITLGFDEPASWRGTPRLARGEEARAILARLIELSRPYGTDIGLDGEIGRVYFPNTRTAQS